MQKAKWAVNESSSIQVSEDPPFELTCILVLMVSKLYNIMVTMAK